MACFGHVPGQERRACGTLLPELLRQQHKAIHVGTKGIIAQLCPVSNQKFCLLPRPQDFPQLFQGDGAVVQKPGDCAAAAGKGCGIDLTAVGIHGGDVDPVGIGYASHHGRQRGNTIARDLPPPGKALGRRCANAHAGKAAGTCGTGHRVHIRRGEIAVFEEILRHFHQRPAVGLPAVL